MSIKYDRTTRLTKEEREKLARTIVEVMQSIRSRCGDDDEIADGLSDLQYWLSDCELSGPDLGFDLPGYPTQY